MTTQKEVTLYRNVLPAPLYDTVRAEATQLKTIAETLSPNPHSHYKHVKGYQLRQRNAALLSKVYYDDALILARVQKATGVANLMHMPVPTTKGFNINCKLNYYNDTTHLGWHYDRIDYQQGRLFVAVLTLWNTAPRSARILQTFNMTDGVRGYGLPPNSMTVHDPAKVYHRVCPLPTHTTRCAFVMLFTTNPGLPSRMAQKLNVAAFGMRNTLMYGQFGVWSLLNRISQWQQRKIKK